MTTITSTVAEAYDDGLKAGRHNFHRGPGTNEVGCPYQPNTREYNAWCLGEEDAIAEAWEDMQTV